MESRFDRNQANLSNVPRVDSANCRRAIILVDPDDEVRMRLEQSIYASSDFTLLMSCRALPQVCEPTRVPSAASLVFGGVRPLVESLALFLETKKTLPAIRTLVLADRLELSWLKSYFAAGADRIVARPACRAQPKQLLEWLRFTADGDTAATAIESAQPTDNQVVVMPSRILTERELSIMKFWMSGLVDKEIADRLGITFETVKSHARHILRKLGARTRVEACARVWR